MTPGGVVGTATSASPGFQTLKKYLAKQDPPATIGQLQVQLDCFVAYDNEVRPHRALKRRTPREAFEARTKASPRWEGIEVGGYWVLHDKVGKVGKVTLRFESRLHHIGLG
jgi:hypothetical protein